MSSSGFITKSSWKDYIKKKSDSLLKDYHFSFITIWEESINPDQ
jgi:hypothetical protein